MALLSESPVILPAHRRILALAWLGWTFDFYDLILYTFITRPITAELGLTRMDHAQALALSFAATAAGGIASGWAADRFGRRAVVSWTILLFSAGCLLSGLAPTRNVLFFARALTGFGVGGEWAAGHALVAETFPSAHRGRAGAILQSGAPVGVGLATLVGVFLVPRFGWRACLIASSATALIAFVTRRWMPESDLWIARTISRDRAPTPSPWPRAFAGDLAPAFWIAMLLTTVNGASYWLTYSWLPEYLRTRGLTLAASGRYLAVIVCGEIVGYAAFGWFSDRLGRRPAFTLFATLMALGLLPLTLLWSRFADLPLLLYAATALVGIGTGTWSNFGPLLAELFPTAVRTTFMGTILNLSRAAQFVCPILIAALEPRWGLSSGISLAAAFAFAAGLIVWLLPETRARNLRT